MWESAPSERLHRSDAVTVQEQSVELGGVETGDTFDANDSISAELEGGQVAEFDVSKQC